MKPREKGLSCREGINTDPNRLRRSRPGVSAEARASAVRSRGGTHGPRARHGRAYPPPDGRRSPQTSSLATPRRRPTWHSSIRNGMPALSLSFPGNSTPWARRRGDPPPRSSTLPECAFDRGSESRFAGPTRSLVAACRHRDEEVRDQSDPVSSDGRHDGASLSGLPASPTLPAA